MIMERYETIFVMMGMLRYNFVQSFINFGLLIN
jgi:hypothetical protein